MSDLSQWQEKNNQYLSAALAWLRLRLARLGKMSPLGQPMAAVKKEKTSWCFWFCKKKYPAQEAAPTAEKMIDDNIDRAAKAMTVAAKADTPPALVILGQRFGLSLFEQEILLLCAAMELDTRISGLCARAQDDPNRTYPTFALALRLFDHPSWDALSPERPLRYWRLLEINQPGATPLTMSALRADERIVNYLKGLNQLDDRLMPFLMPFDGSENGLPNLAASHETMAEAIEDRLRHWNPLERWPVIQLTGVDLISKQQVARHLLSRLEWQGFRTSGELLPAATGEIETIARLWHRESTLLPLALYLEISDTDEGNRPAEIQLNRFLACCGTLTFLDTREPRPGLGLNCLSFEIDKPLPIEQQKAWSEALGEEAGDSPEQLAGQFNLNLPAISQIALSVLAEKQPHDSASKDSSASSLAEKQLDDSASKDSSATNLAEKQPDDSTSKDNSTSILAEKQSHDSALPLSSDASISVPKRLWEACLMRTRPRLDRLAQRLESKAYWNDLVLPGEHLGLLHDIAAQVRQRSKVYDQWGFRRVMSSGFGISGLFTGDSGTGKTMAAEVIANELHLDLYRIDLSSVVSKYIGETEKNLRRVFDASESGGVILFFDEADALFGKRSEVRDSHDRYANIEINYLLQRMEAFRGLAILATNMKSSLDQAFMRRLRFIVNFPFPGPAERKLIWERAFPKDDLENNLLGTPVEALDYHHLARLNLTGGSIHNIALNAAFLAARAGTAVTMPLVFEAARQEFRKLEKPVNEAEFRFLKPVGAKV